jgi:hypothetical protein
MAKGSANVKQVPPAGYPDYRAVAKTSMNNGGSLVFYEPIQKTSYSELVKERKKNSEAQKVMYEPRYAWEHPAYMKFLGSDSPDTFPIVYGQGNRAGRFVMRICALHYHRSLLSWINSKRCLVGKDEKEGHCRER